MAGPGKMWAFVMCAHVAMARGPRVYWDWTVPVQWGHISVKSFSWMLQSHGDALPISPNLRSSKSKKFFRRETSMSLLIVCSEKSSIMSACVLSTQMWSPTSSASRSRVDDVWTSAETQRFDCLIEINCRR